MKNYKKLVIAFLVLVVAAFSFTGCSKTSTQVEMEAMEGIREQNIQSIRAQTEQLSGLFLQATYDDFMMYKAQGAMIIGVTFDNDLASRWKAFTDAHGAVTGTVVDEVARHHYEYTGRIILTGEDNAQMALTITYDKAGTPYKTTIQDYSDDSKLTFGERMAVAGGNTIIGLLTVFTVLVLLSLIIYCFKFVNAAATPPAPKKEASVSVPDKAAKSSPAKAVPAAKKEEDPMLDPALVAVIAAAIAAAEEKPVEGFVVRSIKRVKTNKWR